MLCLEYVQIADILNSRFTAQQFVARDIEHEKVESILEAGRMAPSAKNRQAWRFIAVLEEDMRQKIAEASYGDSRILQAPCVIAACTTNTQYTLPNGQPSHILDAGFAVSYMALQATHEGLGSAIIGTYNEKKVKDLLTVPHALHVMLLLVVGYTQEKPPEFRNRFPKSRVLSYNHW